jgi:hypothetical protein
VFGNRDIERITRVSDHRLRVFLSVVMRTAISAMIVLEAITAVDAASGLEVGYSQSNILFVHRCSDHRSHSLPEVRSASDRPCPIERHGLMGSIDHHIRRSGQRLECRQRQPSKSSRIIFELGAIRRGDCSGDLLDHRSSR